MLGRVLPESWRRKIGDRMKVVQGDRVVKTRIAEQMRELWQNQEHREKCSQANSEATTKQWRENQEYRDLMVNLGRSRIRENAPGWKGGKSFEPYTTDFDEVLKEKIRDRDGRVCQVCGVPEYELYEKLHVHHIDYNKKNCLETNLISLCRKHHVKTNFRREFWYEFFTNKMLYAAQGAGGIKSVTPLSV
jgi:hypothetical protein